MHDNELRRRLPAVAPALLSVLWQGAAQAPSFVVSDAAMGSTLYLPALAPRGNTRVHSFDDLVVSTVNNFFPLHLLAFLAVEDNDHALSTFITYPPPRTPRNWPHECDMRLLWCLSLASGEDIDVFTITPTL